MAIEKAWLEELAARTTLSALVGRSVKLTKAGREHKGCCPFHHEKTPSFTVNDAKGFYHCFGCGAHGDALRWVIDHDGLPFIDAVKQLAEAAGMEVPARSPQQAERAARIDGIRPALEAAAAWYAGQLEQCGAAREYLNQRGFGPEVVARFGLGWAPKPPGHVRDIPGMGPDVAKAAGLMWEGDGRSGATFRSRVMVPVHDARGRLVAFGGRVLDATEPKYKNSPDSEIFDKGRVLFNLHRAGPALREQRKRDMGRGDSPTRLMIVEGYMDVIALDAAGFGWAVAPMGTAMTEAQLEIAWRQDAAPVVMMDGDKAGRAAAVRLAVRALPMIAPGRSLSFAALPDGMDPDDALKAGGVRSILAAVAGARGLALFLFEAVVNEAGPMDGPDAVAAVWQRLAELGATIGHDELRAQYLADWRRRFDARISLARPEVMRAARGEVVVSPDGLSRRQADAAVADGEGGEDDDRTQLERMADEIRHAGRPAGEEAEERFRAMVRSLLADLDRRDEVNADIRDKMSVMKAMGFDTVAVRATLRDMRADPAARESVEAMRALYRRIVGVKGPLFEDVLPQLTTARVDAVGKISQQRATAKIPAQRRMESMIHQISHDVGGGGQ